MKYYVTFITYALVLLWVEIHVAHSPWKCDQHELIKLNNINSAEKKVYEFANSSLFHFYRFIYLLLFYGVLFKDLCGFLILFRETNICASLFV